MTNEAIEAAARAMAKHTGWPVDYDNLEPVVREALRNTARAASTALMEEGARLERERIVALLKSCPHPVAITIRAAIEGGEHWIDAIVKGAGRDRD